MWFWIFMFLCNLLIPLFMAGFGRVMLKHPPKEINNFVGYRTAMSRKTGTPGILPMHCAEKYGGKQDGSC